MKRDTYIFYRSFYEAISELPEENQLDIYKSIAEYSLNFKEPKLSGISKTIWILIKPQLDANNKRFMNGKTPKKKSKPEAKPKQKVSKPEANNNNNNNNNNNYTTTNKFLDWFNNQKKKFTGKNGNFKGLSKTDVNNLKKLMKDYNQDDFNNAIPSLFSNQWAKDTNNLTPTHFLRVDNFNKYLNQDNGIAPAPKTESLYD